MTANDTETPPMSEQDRAPFEEQVAAAVCEITGEVETLLREEEAIPHITCVLTENLRESAVHALAALAPAWARAWLSGDRRDRNEVLTGHVALGEEGEDNSSPKITWCASERTATLTFNGIKIHALDVEKFARIIRDATDNATLYLRTIGQKHRIPAWRQGRKGGAA